MCASGAHAFSGTFLLNNLHSFSSFSASVQHPLRALLCVFSVLLLCTVYAAHHMRVLCAPSMCTAATYMHAHRSCRMTIIAHVNQQSSTAHTASTQPNFWTALVGNPSGLSFGLPSTPLVATTNLPRTQANVNPQSCSTFLAQTS